jgi:hypothetical protein
VIDPSQDLTVVPGGFFFIQSENPPVPTGVFSMVDVRLQTPTGEDLALTVESLTVVMPVAARVAEPPSNARLYRYDEALGLWTDQGPVELDWDEVTGEPVYVAYVLRHGTFAVATPLDTYEYTSCIVDSNGQPLAGALIEAHSLEPLSITSTRSDANGNFSILVPSYGQTILSAVAPTRSRARLLYEEESYDCLEALDDGLRITLSWGAEPSDLDLYLYAADFGVWYGEHRVPVGDTFVTLDLDETDGWGPEIISSGPLPEGRYRLVVHQYAGELSIGESPTRLRVQTKDTDVLIRPGEQGDGTTDAWVAADLVVDAEGHVSVVPVDLFAMLDTVHLACPDPGASDPMACTFFQCGSGEQISNALYCDGTPDCQDGSDEQGPRCWPPCGDAGPCEPG